MESQPVYCFVFFARSCVLKRNEEYLPRFPGWSLSSLPALVLLLLLLLRPQRGSLPASKHFFFPFFPPPRQPSYRFLCGSSYLFLETVLVSLCPLFFKKKKRDLLRECSWFLSYSREPQYYNPTTDRKNGVNSLAGF